MRGFAVTTSARLCLVCPSALLRISEPGELNRRERQIEELIEPAVVALGCRVWGINYLSQGKHSILRIYIEKQNQNELASEGTTPLETSLETPSETPRETQAGISIEDCERVSRQVSELLDVEETINGEYTLEVSSPGLDRQLFRPEQYTRVLGEVLDVRLSFPFDGRKKFVGQLVGVEDSEAVIQIDGEEFLLPIETIQKAHVVPTFDESDLKPAKGKAGRQPEKNA